MSAFICLQAGKGEYLTYIREGKDLQHPSVKPVSLQITLKTNLFFFFYTNLEHARNMK